MLVLVICLSCDISVEGFKPSLTDNSLCLFQEFKHGDDYQLLSDHLICLTVRALSEAGWLAGRTYSGTDNSYASFVPTASTTVRFSNPSLINKLGRGWGKLWWKALTILCQPLQARVIFSNILQVPCNTYKLTISGAWNTLDKGC